MKKYSNKWPYVGLVVVAWVAYILLTISAPATPDNPQTSNLSTAALTILTLSILAPYLLTWLIAVIGWYNFSWFATDAVYKKIPGHQGIIYISRGLGILIFDLILVPMFSVIRRIWGDDEPTAAFITILSNYFHVVIPLVAFSFMYIGSLKLAASGHYASAIRIRILPALLATIVFIALFCLAVTGNTSRQVAHGAGQFASFYISDPLIILTIIIPLAITWFLGLQTALNTERYMHSFLQPVWRTAIIHLFHGLLAIVSSAIILQAITAFGNHQLQQISFVLLLVILFLFIFLQAAGYFLIRKGAKQLRSLIKTGTPHEID